MIEFANICMLRTKIALLRTGHTRVIESISECENVLAILTTIIDVDKIKKRLKKKKYRYSDEGKPNFADLRWLLQAYGILGAFYDALGN